MTSTLKAGLRRCAVPYRAAGERRAADMMNRCLPYILVAVGGSLGAIARYILSRWVGTLVEGRFPLGTFLINVSGSFFLGLLGAVITQKAMPNADALRLALGVGFLGAFTTFSTFEYETHSLFEDGVWVTALMYIFLSLFVGLVAVRLGVVVVKSWF
jgi:fluoride exporter